MTLSVNSPFLSSADEFPKARGCPVGPSCVAASVEAVHWNSFQLAGPRPRPASVRRSRVCTAPLVSSFAPPDARTRSFQPRRFPSATLPAGRGLDGEQVASGPGAVPVTPAAGECLNKDCQCENVREEGGGRGEEGVHLSSGLCISPELVTAPWLTAGGASVSSLRGPVFTA